MALNPLMLIKLVELMKPGQAIASMGYPDIVMPEKDIEAFLDGKEIKYRPEADKICARHGIKPQKIPDAESFFEAFGVALDVYDVVEERGGEVIVDLNYPIPSQACGQYDYVLDVGTLEHCFNIPQALINMAALVNVGGVVFHDNPFNWGNHGFYNLCPTLFHDFYTENGFEVEPFKLIPRGGQEIWDVPATGRFVYKDKEANIFTVARRVEIKEFTFPTQSKYKAIYASIGK